MAEPIELAPCPYCGGPPCVSIKLTMPAGRPVSLSVGEAFKIPDEGCSGRAYVWCHECGSQGPGADGLVYADEDSDCLKRQAGELWNRRDSRHLGLYISGHAEGLQMYPRPDPQVSVKAANKHFACGVK
jgi:hypothetical protein